MAAKCKTCEVEITGIEKIACRGCSSVFHRSCITGLNRTAFETIGKHPQNLFWLCDDCAGRFDRWLQSMDVDDDPAPSTEATKLCEAVDKLSGIVSTLSSQLEKQRASSYSDAARFGQTNFFKSNGLATPKRGREEEGNNQLPPAKIKTVCGTRTIQHQIKTVVDERSQFWVYLGRLDPCHTPKDIAEISQECLGLDEPPKVVRLVKKDADITKMTVVSFRVLLPDDKREIALQGDTWPAGVTVH